MYGKNVPKRVAARETAPDPRDRQAHALCRGRGGGDGGSAAASHTATEGTMRHGWALLRGRATLRAPNGCRSGAREGGGIKAG